MSCYMLSKKRLEALEIQLTDITNRLKSVEMELNKQSCGCDGEPKTTVKVRRSVRRPSVVAPKISEK